MDGERSEIGKELMAEKEQVLNEWEDLVRSEIKAAEGKDSVAIKNTIPELIDRIAETLCKRPPKSPDDLEHEFEIAKEHGVQRSTLERYSVEQIVHEYQLLRRVILQKLESERELDRGDRDVVLDTISFAERKATSEFTRIRAELEKGMLERTRERDEEKQKHQSTQLQLSDLEEVRETRERFVAMLTHDLRSPIAAAKMNLQLQIRKKEEPGAVEKYSVRALDNLSRLDAMIQDLLDANRISAGERLPIKPHEMNLLDCLSQVLDELTAMHGDRFELKMEGALQGVWDGVALQRAVENLCSNAVKYGYPATPIVVSATQGPEGRLTIRVHNLGPEIPEVVRSKLFQPFQRARSAQMSHEKGWGIGLTLVKGVAEAHGGSVAVESSKDGTTFSMTLPRNTEPNAEQKSA